MLFHRRRLCCQERSYNFYNNYISDIIGSLGKNENKFSIFLAANYKNYMEMI